MLKSVHLDEEITYVINRLKTQKVINGWWVDGKRFVRRLTFNENKAYCSLINKNIKYGILLNICCIFA